MPSHFQVEIEGSIHAEVYSWQDSAQIDAVEITSSVESPSASLKLPGRIVRIEETTDAMGTVVLYDAPPESWQENGL